ncbi:MAG: hypothetical protein OHK0046_19240 [Anaerolineae bacterium]
MDNYSTAHKAVIDALVSNMPNVVVGKAFGYPAYKINGKVFAFVGSAGVALKLPEARVQELIQNHEHMHSFEPSPGTVWREWVSIDREKPTDHQQDMDLLEESMQFVLTK